ncbi:MAG TPA: GntR family transcriptional regulator [Azospirillum sp.]|nr:GntR family transcriptional regulator [Azospirillum sp.]
MSTDGTRTAPGRAPRLNEQVMAELERQIAAGTLALGDHLTEPRLAGQFGVSRAPVRDALRQMEERGLVRRAGNRRSWVVAAVPAVTPPVRADAGPRKLTAAASWEGIYREVSRQTVARAAFGGWRITETDLAAHHGVSRTVAREVLGRLEQEGIIRKDSRSRWTLPALTAVRIGELYEMRRVLEPMALRRAAERVPAALLRRMRGDLEDAVQRVEDLTPHDLDRLEQDLHVELLSYADHTILLDTLQHYHALLITNAVLYEATSSAFGAEPFVGEHLDIVRALESRRPDAAAEHLEQHLRVAQGRALGRLDQLVRSGVLDPLPYLTPLPVD